MTYEFNDDEAEKMWVFGNKIAITSVLMAVGGILGIFSSITKLSGSEKTRTFVLIAEFIFLIAIALILYRPSDNFKIIATSEGRDIPELMSGIKEFSLAFFITAILIFLIGVLNFLLIISKI